MSCGGIEFGKCEVCGEEKQLRRTTFYYDIKCECHSPQHFELRRHCNNCKPKEPEETRVLLKTEALKNPVAFAMSTITKELKADKSPGSYYYSWQSNIACSIMDNSDLSHEKANEIAVNFLELLIG